MRATVSRAVRRVWSKESRISSGVRAVRAGGAPLPARGSGGRIVPASWARGASAGSLGLAPWQVDRARRDLIGWTDEGLGAAIQALAATDAAVKGAERDPVFALERLVGIIASRGRVGA